ncbi:hypothetical protein ACLOJK_039000 [Asimina triloba]
MGFVDEQTDASGRDDAAAARSGQKLLPPDASTDATGCRFCCCYRRRADGDGWMQPDAAAGAAAGDVAAETGSGADGILADWIDSG